MQQRVVVRAATTELISNCSSRQLFSPEPDQDGLKPSIVRSARHRTGQLPCSAICKQEP